MEAKLIPLVGSEEIGEVSLSPSGPVVLGRGESADVQLRHSKISRIHCRIFFENGFYTVQDLDSKNGTWVNDRRIHKAILFNHDRIALGSVEFRFALQDGVGDETATIPVPDGEEVAFETKIRQRPEGKPSTSILFETPEGTVTADREVLERNLSAVCRIINSVNSEEHLDRLFETIMDSAMEVTGADRGYLIAAKKINGVLMPLISRNREGLPTYAQNTFSRSIVSECYSSGYSILVSDPTSQENPSESIIAQQIQSVMCVPMCDEAGPVGVIYVDRLMGSSKFTESELKVLTAIGNQAGMAVRRAQLSRQVETLFRDAMRVLINLLEVKDEYTYSHSERVTAVALRIGELLELDKWRMRDLELAGLLHDVGKLAVRVDILQKPSSLTDSEYELVKQHPATGAAILQTVENAERIAAAVRHHHEWWDGSGYPDGVAGEDIPQLARILALADAFDSMAAGRPYRAVMPESEIVAELSRGSGTQFDPELAGLFVAALQSDPDFRRRIEPIYARRGQEPSHSPFE